MRLYVFFIIILIIIIYISYTSYIERCIYINKYKNIKFRSVTQNIPKVIYQCYHDKSKIPQKVYNNIQKFAPNYKHVVYNDDECKSFIKKNYGQKYINIFNYLLKKFPAFGADFWRYLILYKYGGIYLDIKIELIEPMDDTINRIGKSSFATILGRQRHTPPLLRWYQPACAAMQGVIFSSPSHPILKLCIDYMKKKYKLSSLYLYNIFTANMYDNIIIYNNNNISDYTYFFKEYCTKNKNDCYDGLDRYGRCCYVKDKNINIIKTRYADFPW